MSAEPQTAATDTPGPERTPGAGRRVTAKPAVLAVDDDPQVLRAIQRDLRRHYGEHYRVLHADSGPAALDVLKRLKVRGDPVALLLVDQRMPGMSGVDLLEQARPLHPDAKRALLTAYADTDAAIKAINDVDLDYYLQKPWDPPDERLYPVLDDLLDQWQAAYRPPFLGLRLVGDRWSPASYELKDFLTRNQVPYRWIDMERDPEGKRLLEAAGADGSELPIVLSPDGPPLTSPTTRELAESVGLSTQAKKPFYDLVIVGGGPSGLAAAVYGASEGLSTVMVEREAAGGQAGTSSRIENYLGFPVGLTGADLARRATAQARRFGAELISAQEVLGVRVEDPYRYVVLGDGTEISCHTLLVASGVSWRLLEAPGVARLVGKGIYYGASQSEALSCQDDDVYIVGGGNSAGQAAVYFSKFARRVSILVRGASLAASMSKYLIDQIEATDNIELRTHTTVAEAHGDTGLDRLTLEGSDGREDVRAGALFLLIGAIPHTDWVASVCARDERGFILSGPDLLRASGDGNGRGPRLWKLDRDPYLLETSTPGIFVAGDVRHGSIKRVASSVGEGAMAVQFMHQYLEQFS